MLAYSCAEGVLENADRILGKHIAKTGMDYVNNALRGTLENPERTQKKKLDRESGSAFFRACRSDSDPHFLLISAADPIRISDRDKSSPNVARHVTTVSAVIGQFNSIQFYLYSVYYNTNCL